MITFLIDLFGFLKAFFRSRYSLGLEILALRVLYCCFVIEHGRRRILHFNVTEHPTGRWIVQQLRETFRESCQYHYAILDRNGKFGEQVTELLTASGVKPTRTSAPALGRMELQNAGLEAVAESFSTR